MSAGFNLSSEKTTSTKVPGGNSGDDNNYEAYVEIILDIFDNSVAIHSLHSVGGGWALHEDPELSWLAKKTLESRSTSRARSSFFRNTSSHIKHVFQDLKLLASGRFDRTKSAAAHALKGLKFIG